MRSARRTFSPSVSWRLKRSCHIANPHLGAQPWPPERPEPARSLLGLGFAPEAADGHEQPAYAPRGDDRQVAEREPAPGRERAEAAPERLDEVAEREDVRDRLHPLGRRLDRVEDPGEERQREE